MAVEEYTVEQYHQLIEAGVLWSGDPVELLERRIVTRLRRTPAHEAITGLTEDAIRPHLPAEWHLRIKSAVTTSDSEPEPDLLVIRGPARRYIDHHPSPAEVGLLDEVADTSLPIDRGLKRRIYARGIPMYWIVNVVDLQVEVYT